MHVYTDTNEEASMNELISRGLTTSRLTTRTPSMDSPTLNTWSSPMTHSSESLTLNTINSGIQKIRCYINFH